ncbi:MAG: enoyl-CoA hydratase/isomerase family protein [Proteobacteria bacterium]|nr:enoyl-CoA hydratase/isomerase family protein [Pseudomonadota bacterium]
MLESIRHENTLELRLSRPPVNALNPELVRRVRKAVENADAQGARGIVLCGQPGMFSAGLDVPELLQLDRPTLIAFWQDFFGLCAALACSPIPVVAAIGGHSPAGGAVLSIFCDYRVMARSVDPEKPFRIGLNEVQVGLSVPEVIQCALRRLVGTYRAERMMVVGQMLDPEQALQIGMVDELANVDGVVPRALEWLRGLLALPPQAMATTRLLARSDLIELFADPTRLSVEEFADGWFGTETQTMLKALVAKLKKS